MTTPKIRAAIFDLDGTLVDAFADITAAINAPLERRGLPTHTVEDIHRMVGDGAGKLVEMATPAEHHENLPRIRAEMMVHYRKHGADTATIYPGALAVLDALKAEGVVLGLLTNKAHDVCEMTLKRLNLGHYFAAVQGEAGETSPRKPDPRALSMMIQQLGAAHAVMVGDGVPDGEVAMAAGIPFVACLWGSRNREQLAPFSPVAFASDPTELLAPILQALGLSDD